MKKQAINMKHSDSEGFYRKLFAVLYPILKDKETAQQIANELILQCEKGIEEEKLIRKAINFAIDKKRREATAISEKYFIH